MAAVAEVIDVAERPPRIGVVDTARGLALLAMASYHFTWDLEFFGYLMPGTVETGWLRIYARAIAATFLFLVGVSIVLAGTPEIRWNAYLKRLGMVAGAAALITIATRIGMPNEFIFFGILHCIAAASIVGLPFLRLPLVLVWLAAVALLGAIVVNGWLYPNVLQSAFFDSWWLYWLGFSAAPPRSNDFVPLFPWLTPFLLGLAIARTGLWLGSPRRLASVGTGSSLAARAGRHSLIIYLVHQPLLFGCVYLLSLIVPAPPPDPVQSYLFQCRASCMMQEGEAICRSFCQCTLDKLQAQNLFTPLQSGAIQANNDERVQSIAVECTAIAQ